MRQRRVTKRNHEPKRRVGDGEAGAATAEQLLGHRGLEAARDRTIIAERARSLDRLQPGR